MGEAQRLFGQTGIINRSDGCRYLGGALGTVDFCQTYLESMANRWCTDLKNLADLAGTQPHAAYTVFTKGFSSKWRFHMRYVKYHKEVFQSIDSLINSAL